MTRAVTVAELRVPLILQSALDTPDALGGYERQWQDVAEVWAALETFRPRTGFDAGQPQSRISHRITIRWRPDVALSMQFSGPAGTFAIHGAYDADNRRAFLVCYCEEVRS
ncbi:MAG: phage head closure protein [Hyphomicrobiales bacterium]|nr:phage head closure protein [Hyphomicrobiales bacterium]